MWQIVFFAFVLIGLYQVSKRVSSLEQGRGPGQHQRFSVDANEAVTGYKKFGELLNIKSAAQGKPYRGWTKDERVKFSKKQAKLIRDRSRVWIQYLPADNCYFIKSGDGTINLVNRESINTTTLLYSTVIAGDEEGVNPKIELSIYERLMGTEWVVSPCLEYSPGYEDIGTINNDCKQLCDFPVFRRDTTQQELDELGFSVKEEDRQGVYEDSFGEQQLIPAATTYEKNGVRFTYTG